MQALAEAQVDPSPLLISASFKTWYRIVGEREEPGRLPLLVVHGGRRHSYRSSATRRSWSAMLGTTKDARKIGRKLFPVHRKATVWLSAASKV